MKRYLLYTLLSISSGIFAQTTAYQGPCCDKNGKPVNPADFINNRYHVKKHKKTTMVELSISAIQYGEEVIRKKTSFAQKIKSETGLIELTDLLAVKLIIARMTEYENNHFLYKLAVYKNDSVAECWRPLSIFSTFYEVYQQTISLNKFGIGTPNTEGYFEILEGYIRLNQ